MTASRGLTHVPPAAAGRRVVEQQRRDELMGRIEQIMLTEGFSTITMDDLASRLHCSKATVYGIAPTKSDLVVAVVKKFFETATAAIEDATTGETDSRRRIKVYLRGVGREMGRHSAEFYRDMMDYEPTASIYGVNSDAAARRVRELVDSGVSSGHFRAVDAAFASELVVLAIDGVRSGRLLERTGLTAGEAFAEMADILLDGLQYAAVR